MWDIVVSLQHVWWKQGMEKRSYRGVRLWPWRGAMRNRNGDLKLEDDYSRWLRMLRLGLGFEQLAFTLSPSLELPVSVCWRAQQFCLANVALIAGDGDVR
ncbi:hypothetical protein CBR_g36646 [Chara braunii]|uniref:Uncharacterized protein n=1 Tax=Chara braunii TaxID=69332 RepID=A0A388LL58_CHABU|nr:hypothetical protein CBR_g36646 [Chara braunii]|eukprot:GBG83027.1 hypothetical protein CBR_g36646 [Chara braunii]